MSDQPTPLRTFPPGVQTTHWADCWSSHRECAIAHVERLTGQLAITREAGKDHDARVADLICQLNHTQRELAAVRAHEWDPAPGHWYVEYSEHGRQMSRVGDVMDIDQARLRVALQAAHDPACAAIEDVYQATQRLGQPCPQLLAHVDHPGPCGTIPSRSAIVTAVLDAIALQLATDHAP